METPLKIDRFLGLQIRKKREQMGITLTKAAKEMNISPSLLSQVERGIVSPSISTLRTIADYLGTYIGVLLGERISKENAVIIRKGNENRSIIWGKGIKLHILSPSNSNLEFMYDEYEVNSSTGDKLYRHEGEECAFVLEGKLEINLNGKKFILNEGDFIWFLSTIPHQIINLSDKKSIAIWVDSPPRF
jgi:transcriptional regulator with XRE-family HTH domain